MQKRFDLICLTVDDCDSIKKLYNKIREIHLNNSIFLTSLNFTEKGLIVHYHNKFESDQNVVDMTKYFSTYTFSKGISSQISVKIALPELEGCLYSMLEDTKSIKMVVKRDIDSDNYILDVFNDNQELEGSFSR